MPSLLTEKWETLERENAILKKALRRIERVGGKDGIEGGDLVTWDGKSCASIARRALRSIRKPTAE